MATPIAQDDVTALWQVICRLERAWLPPYPETDDRYGWEPLPLNTFLSGMAAAKAEFIKRHQCFNGHFLDVGCGIGTKMLLAFYLGWRVRGVELHEPYAEVASRLCPEAEIIVGDAWTCDLNADLVYCYQPLVDGERQTELDASLASRCTPGTLLFLPHRNELDAEPVAPNLWVV